MPCKLRILSDNAADRAEISSPTAIAAGLPLDNLKTDRTAGSIAYIGGWLCFCNGTHWFKSNGEQMT